MRRRAKGTLARAWAGRLAAMAALCCALPAGRAEGPPVAVRVPQVFAAYRTSRAEPGNASIHAALEEARQAGRLSHDWQDSLDTADKQLDAIERAIAAAADVVVTDAADAEEEILALARRHPRVAFLLANAAKPQPPNVSVFEADRAAAAYLCGLVAGRTTKSNTVGVVAARHAPVVQRTVNAFLAGAREANPAVKSQVTFLDAGADQARVRAATLAQVAAGVDVIFSERAAAIAAAGETGVLAFGDLVDARAEPPEHVVTGTVWSLRPALDRVVARAAGGETRAEDLGGSCTLANGGLALAPWHGWETKLPPDLLELVEEKRAALVDGTLTLDIPAAEAAAD